MDFAVKIEAKKLEGKPDYVNVIFNITEGNPYKIGEIKINGGDIFTKEELMKLMVIKNNDIYNYKKEEASVEAIKRKLTN